MAPSPRESSSVGDGWGGGPAPGKAWLWPASILVAACLAFGWRVWFLGESFYLRDFLPNYVPSRALQRESLLRGEVWLWNQWIGGGLPTLPDANNSVLYFLYWPWLLFPDQAWALSAAVLLHSLVAALGTFVLCRLVVPAEAAVLGALSFAFGGLMVSDLQNVQWHFAYVWAPWWLWALLRARGAPTVSRFLVVAAFWGLQLLACEPQIVYIEGLLGGCLLLGRPLGRCLRRLSALAGSAMAALLLALPQMWALAEAATLSARAQSTTVPGWSWQTHPLRLLELLLPVPWGGLVPTTDFSARALIDGPWNNFYFASLYPGALVLPLAAVGLSRLKRRHWRFVLPLGGLLLAAMGRATPVFEWLQALPLWQFFRYPERLLVLPWLGLAVLVALGTERWQRVSARRRQLPVALALMGTLLIWLWSPFALQARSVLHAALLLVVLALLAVRWRPREQRLAALVLIADLFFASLSIQDTWTPPEPHAIPAYEELRATNERLYVDMHALGRATTHLAPVPAQRRAFELALLRPNLNAPEHIRSLNAASSLELSTQHDLRARLGLEEAARRFSTRFIVASEQAGLSLYSEYAELPLGLALYRTETPSELCIVSDQGTCRVNRPSDRRLLVELESRTQPAIVHLTESYYPGWVVRSSDGSESAAVVSDVAFLGAEVAPHTTTVELVYEPAWWLATMTIWISAWLMLATVLWMSHQSVETRPGRAPPVGRRDEPAPS